MDAIKTIVHFPDLWSGIADRKTTDKEDSWQGRLIRVARMPVIGMVTSTLGALFNLIRLICCAVIIPFSVLASFFYIDAYKLAAYVGIFGGLSLTGGVYSIVNIASFGLLSWKTQPILGM